MTTPSFARLEIALGNSQDIVQAISEMRLLANNLQHIVAQHHGNQHTMRLLAHDAIRATSGKTRIGTTPTP